MPDPEPLRQATADEACCHILSAMVDLYEAVEEEFTLTFIALAYYIMRNTEAHNYLKAQPQIANQLCVYNNYMWTACPSIITTTYEFGSWLRQLS